MNTLKKHQKEQKWERILEKAITAVCIFAIVYFGGHILLWVLR